MQVSLDAPLHLGYRVVEVPLALGFLSLGLLPSPKSLHRQVAKSVTTHTLISDAQS